MVSDRRTLHHLAIRQGDIACHELRPEGVRFDAGADRLDPLQLLGLVELLLADAADDAVRVNELPLESRRRARGHHVRVLARGSLVALHRVVVGSEPAGECADHDFLVGRNAERRERKEQDADAFHVDWIPPNAAECITTALRRADGSRRERISPAPHGPRSSPDSPLARRSPDRAKAIQLYAHRGAPPARVASPLNSSVVAARGRLGDDRHSKLCRCGSERRLDSAVLARIRANSRVCATVSDRSVVGCKPT